MEKEDFFESLLLDGSGRSMYLINISLLNRFVNKATEGEVEILDESKFKAELLKYLHASATLLTVKRGTHWLVMEKSVVISDEIVADFMVEYITVLKEVEWEEMASKVKALFGDDYLGESANGEPVVHSRIKKLAKRDNISWNRTYWSYDG